MTTDDARDADIIRGLVRDRWTPEKITEQHGFTAEQIGAALGADTTPHMLKSAAVAPLIGQLRGWLDLPDEGPVVLGCAAATTTLLDGEEAAWLLEVAPPSAGKTEAVNLLDGVTDGRLNDITVAGLLGWSRGKNPRPTGVLARVGGNALITFGDLSSLLATSDRGGRDAVFGLLRRAYDGHVTRDISTPNGGTEGHTLEWRGRLTVVAAVTSAIDGFSAHTNALGPRWLYVRSRERAMPSRRSAARAARRAGVRESRAEARELAADIILAARGRVRATTVPDTVAQAIEDAVLVTCWGRAVVPRSGYGRREIEDVPIIEEPPRLVRQAHVLARGLYALGYPDDAVAALMRRVALDSMPAARLAVLRALAASEGVSTAAVARGADVHWYVAHRHCEDLMTVGVVDNLSTDGHGDDARWLLRGDEGRLVQRVILAALAS